jgi:hypothetical protein
MSDLNDAISFVDLLQRCSRIEVPQIQRDYAQGRETEEEVRREFLDALYGALQPDASGVAASENLDFVYGSIEAGAFGSYFLPLDGQQRLTTLFFLHWYLSWCDDQLPDFQSRLWDGRHSRFTYKVRSSSVEFFDQLVMYVPDSPPRNVGSVRKLIEERPWFFLSWRLDPTIQSALTMLDAIHTRFRSCEGLYGRLVDVDRPAITFRLLQLENFGLSDDLYIKMNARGKPLTAFETFKARFEEDLKTLFPTEQRKIGGKSWSVRDFFAQRIDTHWTDLFWNYRSDSSKVFDIEAMNLFWALARMSLDSESKTFVNDTFALQYRRGPVTYSVLRNGRWLTREFAENGITLLEAWSAGGGKLHRQQLDNRYFDEEAIFRKAIKSPSTLTYAELLLLTAFVHYIRLWGDAVKPDELQDWMRVVSNLAQNTAYDHTSDFQRCMAGLRKLLPESRRILFYLTEMEVVPLGFSPLQVHEEVLKAKLLLSDVAWRQHLELAEGHGYFQGQIEFLLDFAGIRQAAIVKPLSEWSKEEHADRQTAFGSYYAKAKLTFNTSGLSELSDSTPRSYLWQRALLAMGNYLMPLSSNLSFGVDVADNGDSWKRFLRGGGTDATNRRAFLKSLWDKLDISVPFVDQLKLVIDRATGLEPWREAFVRRPQVIDYCEQRKIRMNSNAEIYLLKRTKMNGAHAELFSYLLHNELKSESMLEKLAPVEIDCYRSVSDSLLEPCLQLSAKVAGKKIGIAIEFRDRRFRIRLQHEALSHASAVEGALKAQLCFEETCEELILNCEGDLIYDTLMRISQVFKSP